MVYGDFKDIPITTASDNILHNNAFNIVKNIKHDGYQRRLASMVYEILIKRLFVVALHLYGQRP